MRSTIASHPKRRHRGISLLETMLALAISSVMIGLIGMALNISLGTLDRGKQETTAAQLAHTLLRQISHDLRCALPPPGAPSTSRPGTDSVDTLTPDSSADATSASLSTSVSPASKSNSGLMGNREELQWDLLYVPRPDEVSSTTHNGTISATGYSASGIKTVAYFMRRGTADNGLARAPSAAEGLIRRETDRATSQWAVDRGQLASSDETLEPLAPEVESLEFRYFDGTQWREEWDSTLAGRLPVLVEITIGMRDVDDSHNRLPGTPVAHRVGSSLDALQGDLVFRTVVPIAAVQGRAEVDWPNSSDTDNNADNADSTLSAEPQP